jgi:hypothetical protein
MEQIIRGILTNSDVDRNVINQWNTYNQR